MRLSQKRHLFKSKPLITHPGNLASTYEDALFVAVRSFGWLLFGASRNVVRPESGKKAFPLHKHLGQHGDVEPLLRKSEGKTEC